MFRIRKIVFVSFCLFTVVINAQPFFSRVDSIPVKVNGNNLLFPWVGGLNFCQFSEIDLNNDGIKDLFVFDRSGYRISTFINNGKANTVDYVYAPQYENKFPALQEWALLADYNCDGREDIFTSVNGGIKIYRNDSDPINGLKFTLVTSILESFYFSHYDNLYVSTTDIPAITDIDGDGDLDIVTMYILGGPFEYHKNMSKELGYGCDSLKFELAEQCWGNFSEIYNDASLNISCKGKGYDPDSINPSQTLHTGSCELCLDIDGDGDKDILLGGMSFNNMTMVKNGGSFAIANMTSQDDSFPSNSKPVNFSMFPCAFYLDVNNDGSKDLLVSPNAANVSENYTSVWMYKNTGKTDSVSFLYQKNNFLQDQMIDVGEGAYPTFFDYNNDGKMDLLVSNYKYYTSIGIQSQIALFKNTGTLTKPSFQLITRDYAHLSSNNIINMMPTFGDLDGDGDKDMMIGTDAGTLYFFTNTLYAGVDSFRLTQALYKDDLGKVISVGMNASPQLVDVDYDGKLDLIIGSSNGKIAYYRNTGTISAPVFSKITSNLGGVSTIRKSTKSTTGYSVPYMFNLGGAHKLLIGSQSGYIYYYDNINGNLTGNFHLVDSTYQYVWNGWYSGITGTDINNDGLLDICVGNYSGGISMYYGSAVATAVIETDLNKFNFSLYPNPANADITLKLPVFDKYLLKMYDMMGNEIAKEQFSDNTHHIDVSNYSKGVYFIEIAGTAVNKIARKKIIIQ